MNRQPSIHITRSKLWQILKDYMYDSRDIIEPLEEEKVEQEVNEMVEFIMIEAKPFALDKRSITVTNQKLAKEVEKKTSNNKLHFMKLAKIIVMVRRDMKHRGVKAIDINSPEYNSLKRLSTIIEQYAEDYGMDFQKASIDYVTRGLKKISSFRNYVGKLCDMSETIALEKDANDLINTDPSKRYTKDIHDKYVAIINTKTGIAEGYIDNPIKYVHFIEVGNICKKYNIEPSLYLEAQFEGLAWTDSFPEPSQLVSDKAIERLNKFLYTKKIKLGKPTRTEVDNGLSDILKRIKNGEDRD